MAYDLRYCAFVDILGFSELVRRVEKGTMAHDEVKRLLDIVHAPASQYQAEAFMGSDLRAQSISDAVCLSTAVSKSGMAHLIYSLDQLALRLLDIGFFVRGAIVKGRLFHDERMAFGNALIRAYRIETEVTHYPRIMIEREVAIDIREFEKLEDYTKPLKFSEWQFLLCLEQSNDGPMFLNVLRDAGLEISEQNSAEGKEEAIVRYNKIAELVQIRLREAIDNPRHFEKVQWFAKYWNDQLAKQGGPIKRISGPGLNVWGIGPIF